MTPLAYDTQIGQHRPQEKTTMTAGSGEREVMGSAGILASSIWPRDVEASGAVALRQRRSEMRLNLTKADTTLARFWAKVDKRGSDDCWEWTGGLTDGYGSFAHPLFKAHRFSWFIHNGPIPQRLVIRHKCDNRKCVNPAHLEPGTKKDNYWDMIERGGKNPGYRQPRGYLHHFCKLTPEQVAAIRALEGTASQKTIAAEFGVCQITVSKIFRRVTGYE